jgi:hypothetical protein
MKKKTITTIRWDFKSSFIPADHELVRDEGWNDELLAEALALVVECYTIAPLDFAFTMARRIYFNELGFYPETLVLSDDDVQQKVDTTCHIIGKLTVWHARSVKEHEYRRRSSDS